MPDAIETRPQARAPRLSLNSDGKRHPLENGLTIFTLLSGLLSFAVGWIVNQHLLACVAGAASLAVGMYAQMISATRPQRILIVTGMVAAFVGAALGLAHGGFA
jgi:hypothetical protein